MIAAAVESPALINRAAIALQRRPELADTLVGVTGDFVPASQVLRPKYIFSLLAAALRSTRDSGSAVSPRSYQVAEP